MKLACTILLSPCPLLAISSYFVFPSASTRLVNAFDVDGWPFFPMSSGYCATCTSGNAPPSPKSSAVRGRQLCLRLVLFRTQHARAARQLLLLAGIFWLWQRLGKRSDGHIGGWGGLKMGDWGDPGDLEACRKSSLTIVRLQCRMPSPAELKRRASDMLDAQHPCHFRLQPLPPPTYRYAIMCFYCYINAQSLNYLLF